MSDIGFSGNIASSAINASAIEKANQANIQAQKELNRQNRLAHSRANRKGRVQSIGDKKYATYMSNTAVSRKMQDMINAGLNPMALGAEASAGASSSPVGHSSRSVANLARADIKAKNTMNMSGGILDVMSGIANIQNTSAQTSNLKSNDEKIQAEGRSADAIADREILQNNAEAQFAKDNPDAYQAFVIKSRYGNLAGLYTGAESLGSSAATAYDKKLKEHQEKKRKGELLYQKLF